MIIKILGTGCKNCENLTKNTKIALEETGIPAEIIKVTDLLDIAAHGVMSTPGLVIDELVVSQGKVLSPKDIGALLKKHS